MDSEPSIDPRDEGQPGHKEWEEFRATFASAFIQRWLLRDIEYLAPTYYDDLDERIYKAMLHSERLAEEDPEHDGAWPVEFGEGYEHEWWEAEVASLLEQQLFPHGRSADDWKQHWRGLAVVALHSALDSYCSALDIKQKGKALPKCIEAFLAAGPHPVTLGAETLEALIDCDGTRHIVVHNRMVVNERYTRNVSSNRFQVGEIRIVRDNDLLRFADAVWRAASLIRAATLGRTRE